ncbi:MAG: DUF3613 domain-containing protein [Gammaproteobacteria bacterium]
MNRSLLIACSILLLSATALFAAELPTESHGSVTRRWLELQRSGAFASPREQTVAGPIAENIYERYVKSFKYPIPDFFYKSDSVGGNSGGSSSKR